MRRLQEGQPHGPHRSQHYKLDRLPVPVFTGLRSELTAGGAWAEAEPAWVAMVRSKMGWHRDRADPPVPMPEPEVHEGAVLAFRLQDEGEVQVGCVESVGERGVRVLLMHEVASRSRLVTKYELRAGRILE